MPLPLLCGLLGYPGQVPDRHAPCLLSLAHGVVSPGLSSKVQDDVAQHAMCFNVALARNRVTGLLLKEKVRQTPPTKKKN